jgi:hypothetical protein
MKEYARPIAVVNDDVAESVFAASGFQVTEELNANGDAVNPLTGAVLEDNEGSECWTVASELVQMNSNGNGENIYQIRIVHSTSLEHLSNGTKVSLMFNQNVKDARSEFPTEVSGSVVTVNRELLGDSYRSGDQATFKVWATGDDYKTLQIVHGICVCNKAINVQGNGGGEIGR